jgi:hypothetical protein
MTPEEIARVDALDLRCLTLCTNMLERVNSVCVSFLVGRVRLFDVNLDLRRQLHAARIIQRTHCAFGIAEGEHFPREGTGLLGFVLSHCSCESAQLPWCDNLKMITIANGKELI